jgi:LEA14-like dessication related protein
MKIPGWIIILGGGGALWYFYHLNKAVDAITFVFKTVNVINPLHYTVVLTVQNVTSISYTVNSLAGTVLANGYQIATISDFNPVTIPPNAQIDVNIDVQPSLLSLSSAIIAMLNNATGTNVTFEIKGNANVGSLIMPFDLTNVVSF